jgi:hypothetical protein
VTVNVSCIFRPLHKQKHQTAVTCCSRQKIKVEEIRSRICDKHQGIKIEHEFTEKSQKTFKFNEVFGPNSKQVSMSFFICAF